MNRATITYFTDLLTPEHIARLDRAQKALKREASWNKRLRREQAPDHAVRQFQATVFQIQADAEIALSGGFLD